MAVSKTPSAQNLLRVAGSPTTRRHAHLDQPSGQTYSTDPGSRLLFPALCKPTAPVSARTNLAGAHTNRGLMMPRRTTTRAHDRAKRIETERARNRAIRQNPETGCSETYSSSLPPPPADDDDPPPF
jgi:hypothetical protein